MNVSVYVAAGMGIYYLCSNSPLLHSGLCVCVPSEDGMRKVFIVFRLKFVLILFHRSVYWHR